jgi:hypothetical protein
MDDKLLQGAADGDPAFAIDDLLRKRLPDRRRVFESMA